MKVLLDENVAVQVLDPLRVVLPSHDVDHVEAIGWKSKKDKYLIPDASGRGYKVFVTRDSSQLNDPNETALIRRAGIHHVRFTQGNGLPALARAIGSLVAAMPEVIAELAEADGQRLVKVRAITGERYEVVNPATSPPAYWGR